MNLKTITAAAAMSAAIVFSPVVSAQFVGGPLTVNTVADVVKNARDEQLVVLEGYLVEQVRHEKYTFRDATGQILVDIDDKVFAGQRVDPKTKIRIEGEFDKEFMKPDEVDVHRLTVLR